MSTKRGETLHDRLDFSSGLGGFLRVGPDEDSPVCFVAVGLAVRERNIDCGFCSAPELKVPDVCSDSVYDQRRPIPDANNLSERIGTAPMPGSKTATDQLDRRRRHHIVVSQAPAMKNLDAQDIKVSSVYSADTCNRWLKISSREHFFTRRHNPVERQKVHEGQLLDARHPPKLVLDICKYRGGPADRRVPRRKRRRDDVRRVQPDGIDQFHEQSSCNACDGDETPGEKQLRTNNQPLDPQTSGRGRRLAR